MGHLAHLPLSPALVPVFTQAHWPCACASPVVVGLSLKILDLEGRTIHLRGWSAHAGAWTHPPKTAPRRTQDAPRRLQDAFFFASFFRHLFGSIFDRFSAPTWYRKSIKIAQKSMPRCLPSWNPFFDRFLLPTSTPETSKINKDIFVL